MLAGAIFILLVFAIRREQEIIIIGSPRGAPEAPAAETKKRPSPIAHPPDIVKGIYATNWSAGSRRKSAALRELIRETELNAIVIDIKDFSGLVGYETDVEAVKRYRAEEERIADIDALIETLHGDNIYVIGRIAVFQDQALLKARPDLAITSSSTGKIWRDRKGLGWVDPASREVWDYNIAIAKDALAGGFDEINFDYIRFPSDGAVADARYPVWDEKRPMRETLRSFFAYLRAGLPKARLSADIFGLVAMRRDDLGIGQYFEDALPYFDYVSPMIYPSHYSGGFLNFKNPAEHPYEVAAETVRDALVRMTEVASATPQSLRAKLRPWFQDFDLGADYTAEMVRHQMQALSDVSSSSPEFAEGWLLWNPENVYTRGALRGKGE